MPDTQPPSRPTSRFKLAALSAVGVAMVALPLVQVLRYQGAELQAALAEQAGLDPVVRAVSVQRNLLAHRDVAGRVLRGQLSLEAERLSRQGEVDESVARLAGALVVVATDRALEESTALREDWALLARQIQHRSITAPESDLGHRLLVEQTLQVIDLVADASGLGRDLDADAALLASLLTRSLPRLAAEIAALAPPGGAADDGADDRASRHADERQMAATEAALARKLGRLNETIESSAATYPRLAEATADAGAAADRYFKLLREQPDADTSIAAQAAVQAQFQLLDATRDAMVETLSARVADARQSRDVLVALMAVLALLAVELLRRILAPASPAVTPLPASREPAREEPASPGRGLAPATDRRVPGHRSTTSGDETGRLLGRLRQTAEGSRHRRRDGTHAETLPPETP